MSAFSQDLFESDALLSVCGNVARPGGFILTDRAVDFCGLKAGSHLLDVGCGTGSSVAHMSRKFGLKAMGIDTSETMLAKARLCYPAINVRHGRAEALSFVNQSMDAVLSECSMSKFEDVGKALNECCRVLRPGGWLIVSDMYIRETQQENKETGGFIDRQSILSLVKESGLTLALFEEHTDKLAQLVFDIIMEYGSMQNFWDTTCGGQCAYAIPGVKLGYYLLIAQKPTAK